MQGDLKRILAIEVPLKVVIGQRHMRLKELTDLMPGTIIELPKQADDELEIVINNKPIGTGNAVKLGENFGVRIAFIGDLKERLAALAASSAASYNATPEDEDAEALAAQLLAGQI